MNAARRRRIEKVENQIADLVAELEEIISEEQGALDNLPDSLQQADKGQAMEEAIGSLDDAKSDLENVQTTLQEARK